MDVPQASALFWILCIRLRVLGFLLLKMSAPSEMYTVAELKAKINAIELEIEENKTKIRSNISEEEKILYLTINSSLYNRAESLTAQLTNISQSVLQAQLQQNQVSQLVAHRVNHPFPSEAPQSKEPRLALDQSQFNKASLNLDVAGLNLN